MSDDIRWNLRLKRKLHDRVESLSKESGVSKSDIARLALLKFMNGVGEELSLRWVRNQLKIVELQLELKE